MQCIRFFSNIFFFLLFGCLISSCSLISPLTQSKDGESVDNLKGSEKISHSRLIGSSNFKKEKIKGNLKDNVDKKEEKRHYFLYGADHLKLEHYYFDIPVVYNKSVKYWINYFSKRQPDLFRRYAMRAGQYGPLLSKILEEQGLPKDLIFLAMAESGFQVFAKSRAKAVGPWQFMSYTGQKFGLKVNWYVDERRDPIKSTIAATKYLSSLYKRFQQWELAWAAYNAGEGKVGRLLRQYSSRNFWQLRKYRFLRRETKHYVPKIMALAIIGKNLKAFGFDDVDFGKPLSFDEIELPPLSDLVQLSEKIDIPFLELQKLNPELLRWFSPPGQNYFLRVPKSSKEKFALCCTENDFLEKKFQRYTLKHFERPRDIAKKYRLKLSVLEDINGLPMKNRLSKGETLFLPFRENHGLQDKMYADLYELPSYRVRRKRKYNQMLMLARRRGSTIKAPRAYYTVKRGDTLWEVARRSKVSLDTLIKTNYKLLSSRMIRAGDRLAVR